MTALVAVRVDALDFFQDTLAKALKRNRAQLSIKFPIRLFDSLRHGSSYWAIRN